jgi:hypothetical protein
LAKTSIPPKVQAALWARAGGRCEYRGCNCDLIGDLVAGREDGTFGFLAHIVADSPDGPRGDPLRSPSLARSIDNLMLLCARHHKAIDVDFLTDHPEAILRDMKAEHEDRVALLLGIDSERASHVLRFAADIGQRDALVSTIDVFAAMAPDHYPAERWPIDIEVIGSSLADHESGYWVFQQQNLQRQYAQKVKDRIARREIKHLSVFALAPQPLLIELGRLLGDILPVSVHQRHREPSTWRWQADQEAIRFRTMEPQAASGSLVALKLALSATIADERIRSAFAGDYPIWSLTCEEPHNDIMRRPGDLAAFRKHLRRLFDSIKAKHGPDATIHVFPALPVSAAIEVGRTLMPKADLPLVIWDQNRLLGGFGQALRIDGQVMEARIA